MINPIISIILPSYNREAYLAKTIESCLQQTFKNFELIIVDDCSKDQSVLIAKSYGKKDYRIKIITNAVNKKLPATLNIGFNQAIGKYFTWISDDNLFAPTALETMYNSLEENPDIGLVYSDYTTISDEGKILHRIYQEPPEFLPIRDCVGASFLYRSSIAKQVGPYNEQLFLIEDYEYWLRVGLVTKLYHIPETLYFYRIHSMSLTKTRREEIRNAKILLKAKFSNQYKIDPKNQPIYELYNWFIKDKNMKSFWTLFKIIALNPVITLSYIFKNFRRL